MHLFFVADAPTPYRLHFMQRMHAELPGVRLSTRFTHLKSNAPWTLPMPPELDVKQVGAGDHDLPLPRQLPRDLATAQRLIREIRTANHPAVLISGYNDLGRARLAIYCHRHAIPVLFWVDSNARSDRASGIKRTLKRAALSRLFAKTTALLACGSLGREFLIRYGANPNRIHLSPCEPDYAEIETLTPAEIASAAHDLKLPPERQRIVYSGRLVPEKGVDLLVRAFAAVAHDAPDWDLILAGEGPERPRLTKLVPPTLKSRVRFLGFVTPQRKLSALYRNSHVLCLPSRYEPWALVINEAVAAGLAVVASDVVGAAAELVRDGVNGKLFPNNDLTALTACLRWTLTHPQLDQLRAESSNILKQWRQLADPIQGLKNALQIV